MQRILALDVGTARIGVAMNDPLGLAQPLEVIERKHTDPYARILALVEEYDVQKIVVGRPLHMHGGVGEAVRMAEKFIEQLRARVAVPIDTWDERLTTFAAEEAAEQAGLRGRKRAEMLDALAAAAILQDFLNTLARPRLG